MPVYVFTAVLVQVAFLRVTYAAQPVSRGVSMTGELAVRLSEANPSDLVECIVVMRDDYSSCDFTGFNPAEKIDLYRSIAAASQEPLMDLLALTPGEANVIRQYWLSNSFFLEAKPWIILDLAMDERIDRILENGEVRLVRPARSSSDAGSSDTPGKSSRSVEWNIRKVLADSCWAAGFTGEGVVIGQCDTGVEDTHEALEGKWTGYWFDAIKGKTTPYDDHGHGTHTMGTICGGDGTGSFSNDIGVAPGAEWIAAKMLNSSGSGTYAQCMDGLQFIADSKQVLDVRAVLNSWASSSTSDTYFWDVCVNLRDIGILPVFANGNSGPSSGSAIIPGNYSVVLGVGATAADDDIASFSSRGPAPDSYPWNDTSTWYRSDWGFIKPDISAPGDGVRSCLPGGSYDSWSGTSMATPT